MEELPIIFFVGLTVLFLVWITYHQFNIWKYRYFYSYTDEINKFLNENELIFVTSRHPNNIDWEDGCFAKPASIKVSVSLIRINGIPVTWTDKKYLVIDSKDSESCNVKVWLEIETTYFLRPVLTFKKARLQKKFFKPPKIDNQKNVSIVKDVCPACGWKLNGGETKCPECELQFQ